MHQWLVKAFSDSIISSYDLSPWTTRVRRLHKAERELTCHGNIAGSRRTSSNRHVIHNRGNMIKQSRVGERVLAGRWIIQGNLRVIIVERINLASASEADVVWTCGSSGEPP